MKIRQSLCFILLIFTVIFSFSACEKENARSNNSSKPSANSAVKRFPGKGVVTKINPELGSVELDHEEIKGAMPAMIMEFYAADKNELKPLKTGDKVEFVLEEDRGQEKLASIKKINE